MYHFICVSTETSARKTVALNCFLALLSASAVVGGSALGNVYNTRVWQLSPDTGPSLLKSVYFSSSINVFSVKVPCRPVVHPQSDTDISIAINIIKFRFICMLAYGSDSNLIRRALTVPIAVWVLILRISFEASADKYIRVSFL